MQVSKVCIDTQQQPQQQQQQQTRRICIKLQLGKSEVKWRLHRCSAGVMVPKKPDKRKVHSMANSSSSKSSNIACHDEDGRVAGGFTSAAAAATTTTTTTAPLGRT
ncbi:hypothetical protein ACLKA7_016135 [Drosophila subpalustris]